MQAKYGAAITSGGKPRGFTVLELLITLAALGIVVLVSVPGSNMMLEKHRLKSASNSLVNSLVLAQTEASSRSSTVVVCPSSNGHTCRKDGNWNHGWIVFSDGDASGTVQEFELLRAFEAPHQNIRIKAEGAVQRKASLTAVGLVKDQGARSGTFHICLKDSHATATRVTVDADGWVQKVPSDQHACANG